MIRIALLVAVAVLVSTHLYARVSAESPPPRFKPAVQTGETSLRDLEAASRAGNASAARGHLHTARIRLLGMQSFLQQVVNTAGSDGARARAQDVLTRVNDALASVEAGEAGPPDEMAARARDARAHVRDALDELQALYQLGSEAAVPARAPAPPALPAPGLQQQAEPSPSPEPVPDELPRTGGRLDGGLASALVGAGISLIGIGRLLRRRSGGIVL